MALALWMPGGKAAPLRKAHAVSTEPRRNTVKSGGVNEANKRDEYSPCPLDPLRCSSMGLSYWAGGRRSRGQAGGTTVG